MNHSKGNATIVATKDGYPVCPVCRGKMSLKVLPETSGINIPAFCRRCKNEIRLNIDRGQCSRSPSP
ncbi:MAG: hypothetical protein IJ955_10265 [Oscillospiraceae bacterium]|nr:hypothetical protein [Oscillospiraceae bacterium]